jgi:hypothetical protein
MSRLASKKSGMSMHSLQVEWKSTSWSLRLCADNITDRRVVVTSVYANSLFGYDGLAVVGRNAPRARSDSHQARTSTMETTQSPSRLGKLGTFQVSKMRMSAFDPKRT